MYELKKSEYFNGNLAVMVMEGCEVYCKLTVNLDIKLPKNMAFVDVNNLDEKFINQFKNVMRPVMKNGKQVTRQSGFVTYPLYKFNL